MDLKTKCIITEIHHCIDVTEVKTGCPWRMSMCCVKVLIKDTKQTASSPCILWLKLLSAAFDMQRQKSHYSIFYLISPLHTYTVIVMHLVFSYYGYCLHKHLSTSIPEHHWQTVKMPRIQTKLIAVFYPQIELCFIKFFMLLKKLSKLWVKAWNYFSQFLLLYFSHASGI